MEGKYPGDSELSVDSQLPLGLGQSWGLGGGWEGWFLVLEPKEVESWQRLLQETRRELEWRALPKLGPCKGLHTWRKDGIDVSPLAWKWGRGSLAVLA